MEVLRISPRSFLFSSLGLYVVFAVGNLLFFSCAPQLIVLRGGPTPSGSAQTLGLLGLFVFLLGLPANYLLAAVIDGAPSGGTTHIIAMYLFAPALNALLYAAIIPFIALIARKLWQAIMYLPKEPQEE